jgi:adenylylsulfate kinase-like enzyme/SAM-dependent methyltransferase
MTISNENIGGVIWISGYSASGKTTVGRQVNRLLIADGKTSLFLDGDQLRSIFSHKWGYSKEERIELACTYFRLCSHLSKQGAIVVISAVAMFDEAREWFRQNVANGVEIYLHVPLEERLLRDSKTKKIYGAGSTGMDSYTDPESPDLVVENFGGTTPETAARQIIGCFEKKINQTRADYGRTQHWQNFYAAKKAVGSPSGFAKHCLEKFKKPLRLLEIGCGNGRDARFFSQNGIEVVAIDTSAAAIESCKAAGESKDLKFICTDTRGAGEAASFGAVYSRFSLHAMTEPEENIALASAGTLLTPGGLLCIECRSINDPLSRKGQVLSPSERLDGHYRRFIVIEELTEKIKNQGFSVLESQESTGLAPFGDEDPVIIRIIAQKH